MASGDFRIRAEYAKQGRLRWLSHLELARALERGVRRAGLPYAVTHGFSPHMKIAFGPALPVGTAGMHEHFDLWLTRYVRADEVLARLTGALPPDLSPISGHYVPESAAALTAGVLVGEYDVLVEGKEVDADSVQAALDALIALGEFAVVRKGKQKVFDLARCLPKEPRASDVDGRVSVTFAVRMGPEGSLRPDVLLRAALESSGSAGVVTVVTRTDTLVESQAGVWSRPV